MNKVYKMRILQLLFFIFLLCIDCSKCKPSNPDSETVQKASQVQKPNQMSTAVPSFDSEPSNAEPSNDAELVSGVVNDFSFNLFRAIHPNKNSAISPISVFVVMAMAYLGSGGNTRRQLEEALGFNSHGIHGIRLHEDLSNLMTRLIPENDEFKLSAANAMVVAKNFRVKPDYISALKNFYSVMFRELDFNNVNSVTDTINNWIAENTENSIPKFLEEPLNPMARLVLMNAVFFRGTWEIQFPEEDTSSGPFTLPNRVNKTVSFMRLSDQSLKFFEDKRLNHSFIRLPYKGKHISMIIALSDDVTTPDLQMTHEALCRIRGAMREQLIDLLLIPKFRIEYTRELRNPLKTLGARDLFDPRVANLSSMRAEEDLFVSSVNHKVILQVDEKGTVAAAATKITFVRLSARKKLKFIANRPFTFFIVDERSGLVLFHGKVTDPSEVVTNPRVAPRTEVFAKPENAARPEYAAKPENAVGPNFAAKPENAARPKFAAKPENAARPEYAAKPINNFKRYNRDKNPYAFPFITRVIIERIFPKPSYVF